MHYSTLSALLSAAYIIVRCYLDLVGLIRPRRVDHLRTQRRGVRRVRHLGELGVLVQKGVSPLFSTHTFVIKG